MYDCAPAGQEAQEVTVYALKVCSVRFYTKIGSSNDVKFSVVVQKGVED